MVQFRSRQDILTEITADAVRPVPTVRFAVMNLFDVRTGIDEGLSIGDSIGRYISVFLLSSPVVFFKTLVTSIMTISLSGGLQSMFRV